MGSTHFKVCDELRPPPHLGEPGALGWRSDLLSGRWHTPAVRAIGYLPAMAPEEGAAPS
jgi:hypothetical protein